MESPRISIIIHIEALNREYFRECLESITQSTYKNFQVIIADATPGDTNERMASEFFPEKGRLVYRHLKSGRARGYALNFALSLATGDMYYFFDRHSRMSPIALYEIAKEAERGSLLVYSDNDEMVGPDRMNPEFKSAANTELIRHRNYIGDTFAITREGLETVGGFRDNLNAACAYDMLLRSFEKKIKIGYISKLLFSKRILKTLEAPSDRTKRIDTAYREHMTVVTAHLNRMGIDAEVKSSGRSTHWNIIYDGSRYRSNRKEYLIVRDRHIRLRLRDALPKLYGILKQPGVGIVCAAILKNPFTYESCGYIYDTNGISYAACRGQSIFYDGYQLRNILPRDVSMVDFSFCMIKQKLYKGLSGFDKSLSEREAMLDFSLRAAKAGFRSVYVPTVRGLRFGAAPDVEPDATSLDLLLEKHGDMIREGDPHYNKNLPIGTNNYFLY